MKKNLSIISLGLLFLTIALIVGTPFEFLNSTIDAFVTFLLMLLILLFFIFLFKLAHRIEKKQIKRIVVGLICILVIPYLLIGIWTIMMTGGNYYPMWQDISIYTNNDGKKVISQWRETSGSIYDFRDRRIIGDFGQFRISFDCDRRKLKGLWTEYNTGRHTTTTINFDEKNKENKN